MRQLWSTLRPNTDFIMAIKDLKKKYPSLRVHAFSNISAPDMNRLKHTIDTWELFDNVIGSGSIGHRKPEFDSFRRVLECAEISPSAAIFVDDTPENVVTAFLFGIQGFLFDDTATAIKRIHNLVGDPVSRGMKFLKKRSKNLFCETDKGITIKDNFSQLLILQCIGDR
ncbi:haloacid dehalogenase-like hydrolase [Hirsutella rhossiliensis]|uniref:Haloacid dehalogenase-like hydrolase domain-containing protein n=1 Tax=Hirsutella rhossiliensis TaxID=111463 RepID=A0A9P8MVL9_9HYPO|nr:haloacid dehalogenase-like hydrolase domain-containing protein [Hirsutella rhossiliensis]KAH0962222.1 haloacid dehalogenase-like hydrolase domain-containing protein [Hirsutella rhossiliensis]